LTWLLDTNVISEPTKRFPSPEVMSWVGAQRLETLHTLSLACAEIRAGIDRVAEHERQTALKDWLAHKVRPLFGPRIIDPDEEFWMSALRILDRAKANRRTPPVTDLMFAAAADRHDLTVVTRNVRHFEGTGVRVLNPWVAAPTVETV
jgi:predicted nucleic acid-binding protein